MATTSPDNLRTPNPGDPYNLVADLATLASDTQVALNKKVSNLLTGTAAQRVAATGTATDGMLWQDTDGIKMIWRKDGAAWVPAVWRWAGTTAQRDGFTQAPNGFEWFNSSDGSNYIKKSSGWEKDSASTKLGYTQTVGQSSVTNTGTTLTNVTGAAATGLSVTVSSSTEVLISSFAGILAGSGSVLQFGVNLSGATTVTTPTDDPSVGKSGQADATSTSTRVVTLNPGTTTVTVAARTSGSGFIRSPSILVQRI